MDAEGKPPPGPVYADGALGWHQARGVTTLRAWCVAPGCTHWTWLRLDELVERLGATVPLVWVARRCRCDRCGARGAQVEPAAAPPRGTPGYLDWLRAERARCAAFLARTAEDVAVDGKPTA